MCKPLVFISHATEDAYYAKVLADYIEHTIKDVRTFVASDPASITSGGDWFREILENLSDADAIVVIYSRNARSRMWVGFELGYFWRKLDGRNIHCVCDPEVQLPSPLNEKQAKDMTRMSSLNAFFRGLAQDLNRHYETDYDRLPSIIEALPEYDEFAT